MSWRRERDLDDGLPGNPEQRHDTIAAVGGIVAILFVVSAVFPWATYNDQADVYASRFVPVAGAILLGFFGAYWLARGDGIRLLSVCLFATAVGCLGLAALEVQLARNVADAVSQNNADIGAGAVLGLIAAVAAVALAGFMVAQAEGSLRPEPRRRDYLASE